MAFGISEDFEENLNRQAAPAQPEEPAEPANNNEPADPAAQPAQPEADPAPTVPQFEVNDDIALAYLQKKGLNVTSFEDLLKQPEPVEKIVNPYEGLDENEDVKGLLNYVKETGRGIDDYIKLNQDIDKIPALDLARERVRMGVDRQLTNEEVDQYLAKKLGIDLTDPTDIDPVDQIEIDVYAKELRDQKRLEKEKYLVPIGNRTAAPQQQPEELVEMPNGEKITKAQYNQLVEKDNYLKAIKTSVDSVAEAAFKISFDDNGTPGETTYKYEYSQDDRHSMLSIAGDIEKTMEQHYRTKEGFDHAGFSEGLWWSIKENREKVIKSIVEKAEAEATERMMKDEHNVNFNRSRMPGAKSANANATSALDKQGFGVKYNFS